MFAKVKDNDDLMRDMNTQALLRIDLSVVRKHEARVQDLMKESNRTEELADIRNELKMVKDILKQLCGKMNND